jgi:hypothetical protein
MQPAEEGSKGTHIVIYSRSFEFTTVSGHGGVIVPPGLVLKMKDEVANYQNIDVSEFSRAAVLLQVVT